MATITPPLRPIVEPPTPLHGPKFDSYEPYEPRRRSSRLRTLRTPSPNGAKQSLLTLASSSSSRVTRSGLHNLSPPSSPSSPDSRPKKRVKGSAARLDRMTDKQPNHSTVMLPTPVKTPRKRDVKGASKGTARVLFPHNLDTVQDPTPNKKNKKLGFSLDSPGAGSDGKIEIFEDSKEKIPEIDESADNPFYVKHETRSIKGKEKGTISKPAHDQDVRRVLEGDEGMIYVFRGKKVFRKFDEEDYNQPSGEEAMVGLPFVDDPGTPRHFTRSSVKPRFLFPQPSKTPAKTGDTTDEEAITDTDYPQELDGATSHTKDSVTTPAKQRFYATPPTTARTTRTTAKRAATPDSAPEDEETGEANSPFAVKRAKTSPFNKWNRSKPGSRSPVKGRKRDAHSPVAAEGSKRQKAQA